MTMYMLLLSTNRMLTKFNTQMLNKNTKIFVLFIISIVNACIAGTIPATPENITVTFLTPTSVRVSWQTMIDLNAHPIEKYIVTYKPTDDRVVQDVAGNSKAIILDRLSPGTQYSIAVTAIWLGKKYRSRPIIFKTLDLPKPASQQDLLKSDSPGIIYPGATIDGKFNVNSSTKMATNTNITIYREDGINTSPHGGHRELPTIRGVEIGIVLIVLMVWAGAIALFFNRWGKIRMLLPYQPDYKHEQLKVPGTGVCSGGVCNGNHSHQFDNSECGALGYLPSHCTREEPQSTLLTQRCMRSRINSAIFVSSEGYGFDSIEFLRRHGSQSVLCRKARSAENITSSERNKSFDRKWQIMDNNKLCEENDNNSSQLELHECGSGSARNNETKVNTIVQNVQQKSDSSVAAVIKTTTTSSNTVIGSIIEHSVSIEMPPPHLKDDLQTQQSQHYPQYASIASTSSTSHDSTDTVEELISVPTDNKMQRATITSPNKNQTHSKTHRNPMNLHINLKNITRPKVNALPMLSVSGPSPSYENPLPSKILQTHPQPQQTPSECL